MAVVFAVILVIILILVIGGQITANVAMNTQALATLETARALRAAQTSNTVMLVSVAAAVIIFVIVVAVVAIFYVRYKVNETKTQKWVGGPNANFGKLGPGQAPDIQTLMLLMMLKQMNGGNLPTPTEDEKVYLPARSTADELNVNDMWRWG